ncbi:hypothetical protein CDG81_22675 [Actinopolyspora erythraea]|uniref:WXG100 family type VII secretion target n=1 Tax=Actinopolyspora erythraea TaxID=414996 RepID=A0A099D9X5_9ACTN|nr:hypothetical protein [Actinopolyspora erythraea]ASU80610.1 hypothetical protein CDG81_22675 [Actinopolyspora erythraea]KGI82711.1 hypothetical protein IL38_02150 [Actinopolyspora erythraea]
MSFDKLMSKAQEIEHSAAETEYFQLAKYGSTPDYGRIKEKYQNCAVPLFEPFTRIPDPENYQGIIDQLHGAMGCLSNGAHMRDPITGESIGANNDLRSIETAADDLNDWSGMAAHAFKANFLDPFPAVASNQFLVLGIMKGAVEADREVWTRTRDDIENIADSTLEGLDNVGSCGKSDLEFTLSVASAVAAVGAIPFTGGASVAFAAVGAASAVGGAAQKGFEAVKKNGGSAEQVVNSMKETIDALTERVGEEQGEITKALNDYAGEVDRQNKADSPFVSARPKLAGMSGSVLTSGKGVGGHD